MKIQKRLKIALSILMALAMLVVGSPMLSVFAATPVCKIGANTYGSLADAISAAADGDVITVIANTEFSGTIAKSVTITSENGSTVSNASIAIGEYNTPFEQSKEVIFGGNLKLRATGAMFNLKSGTLTFKDNVDVLTTGNYVVDNGDKDSNAKIVCNVMDNASITANSPADDKGVIGIFQNKSGSELNISGGTITQTNLNSYVLKLPDDGDTKVNITGGNLLGEGIVVQMYGATSSYKGFEVNISGGNIISKNTGAIFGRKNAGYAHINISGDAYVEAINDTVQLRHHFELNVTGGTIVAKEGQAIIADEEDAVVSISENAVVKASLKAIRVKEGAIVNIRGGRVEVIGDNKTEQYGIWNEAGMLSIYGGTFVLDGNWASSQMIFHAASATDATTEIAGGLFINKCDVNTAVFGAGVTYTSGRVLYGNNVQQIQANVMDAPKTAQVACGGETYYAYGRFACTDEDITGKMVDGATIRFADGSNGLRFVSTFSKGVVKDLEAEGTVAYGMIIVPVAYLMAIDSISIEALTAKYGANGYLNIACVDGKGVVKNEDGDVIVQAAIVNIKAENYGTAFAAVAYACVDGEYYFTAFDQSVNSASVKDVAAAALADTTATYTDAQKAVLNGYAA